jgi:hypothetical protein
MKTNNDFSFLTVRNFITNIETYFAKINFDKNYIYMLNNEDVNRDYILLQFEQRIWKYNIINDDDNIKIFNSFFECKNSNDIYFMHDIYYKDAAKSQLVHSFSCVPTLSFRTLILDKQNHIKFGLPIFFGNVIRLHPINEALVSMFISDCVRTAEKIPELTFFYESKSYYYNNHTNFCVSHRSIQNCDDSLIPFGNYFNKILDYPDKDVLIKFYEAKESLELFLRDFDLILKYLGSVGLGLELHGQNLLVRIDSTGVSKRKYVYRDFGHCTISDDVFIKNKIIYEYYISKYQYDFKTSGQIDSFKVCAGLSIRKFIYGFLFYNLHIYQLDNNLNYDVYKWGGSIIEQCDSLKMIY